MLKNENELDLVSWLSGTAKFVLSLVELFCVANFASQTMNNASQNAMRYRLIRALELTL